MVPRTQQRLWRIRRRTRNRRRVRGILDNNRGGGGSTTGPRNLRQRWRRRLRKMSTKTTTMTTEESVDDIQFVQGIGYNDGGGSGSTTGTMDLQQKQSVDFPCYRVANSNTVSYLSRRCLVLIFFSSDSFFFVHCKKYYQYCNHAENIFVPSVH